MKKIKPLQSSPSFFFISRVIVLFNCLKNRKDKEDHLCMFFFFSFKGMTIILSCSFI